MKPGIYFKILKTYLRYKLGRPTPVYVSLKLLFRCNLRCSHCGLWKIPIEKELDLEQVKQLIDDLAGLGLPYLSLTGGEPLLRDDLEEIAGYAKRKGIYTALNTNATLVTEERARKMVHCFDVIKISLDGFEKTHDMIRGVEGSFAMANEGMDRLLGVSNGMTKIMVHLVANGKNEHEIPTFVERYHDRVDRVSIMPHLDRKIDAIFDNPAFVENWKKADEAYNLNESDTVIRKPSLDEGKRNCDAAKLYYSIMPDGRVPCCSNLSLVVGDLNDHSIREIGSRKLTADQEGEIRNCAGCYTKCTTEISMLMRKSPLQLLLSAPSLLKKYRF